MTVAGVGLVNIFYDSDGIKGQIVPGDNLSNNILIRIRQFAMSVDSDYILMQDGSIEISWSATLTLLREFLPLQKVLGFKFSATDETKERINNFIKQLKR